LLQKITDGYGTEAKQRNDLTNEELGRRRAPTAPVIEEMTIPRTICLSTLSERFVPRRHPISTINGGALLSVFDESLNVVLWISWFRP
jgi:hypothetical protein